MATYLLTWNPATGTEWGGDISEDARCVRRGKGFREPLYWSCGNRRRFEDNSDVYLVRQGKDRPGLVAHGGVIGQPYEDDHWDIKLAAEGKTAWYIKFKPDYIVDIESEDPLDVKRSKDRTIAEFNWGAQASGILIPEPTASKIHNLWQEFTDASEKLRREIPKDYLSEERLFEGALMRVMLNRSERNPLARQKCLAHYGRRCVVCKMSFGEDYGEEFGEIIEVHHLKLLSSIGEQYQVDPIRDLRPVCPNCHAALHVRTPPLSPDELAKMLGATRNRVKGSS